MPAATCTYGPFASTGRRCGAPAISTRVARDGTVIGECAAHSDPVRARLSTEAEIRAPAAILAARAGTGKYAIWLSLHDRHGIRLGATRIRGLYTPQVLANITCNVGGPVDLRVRVRTGRPVLFIRARFGGDFREALLAVARIARAVNLHANVYVATEPASEVVRKGLQP